MIADVIAARILNSVRVNRISEQQHHNETVLIKTRKARLDWLVSLGNIFLRWSTSRITMFPDASAWKQRELHSHQLLYGSECASGDHGNRSLWVKKSPGQTLLDLLHRNSLTAHVMTRVADEFKRCHSLHSVLSNSCWSHGDPHLKNILFDSQCDRAYLIDFETQHDPELKDCERWADDILVLLLDLMGRTSEGHFRKLASAFLQHYQPSHATQTSLSQRLHPPHGWEKILWLTRTNFLGTRELCHQLKWVKIKLTG